MVVLRSLRAFASQVCGTRTPFSKRNSKSEVSWSYTSAANLRNRRRMKVVGWSQAYGVAATLGTDAGGCGDQPASQGARFIPT